jgi:hypothetical protein
MPKADDECWSIGVSAEELLGQMIALKTAMFIVLTPEQCQQVEEKYDEICAVAHAYAERIEIGEHA